MLEHVRQFWEHSGNIVGHVWNMFVHFIYVLESVGDMFGTFLGRFFEQMRDIVFQIKNQFGTRNIV